MVSRVSGQLAGNRGQKGPAPQVFLDHGRAAPRRAISCPFMPAREPNPPTSSFPPRHCWRRGPWWWNLLGPVFRMTALTADRLVCCGMYTCRHILARWPVVAHMSHLSPQPSPAPRLNPKTAARFCPRAKWNGTSAAELRSCCSISPHTLHHGLRLRRQAKTSLTVF